MKTVPQRTNGVPVHDGPVLEVEGLSAEFWTSRGSVPAVSDVSFILGRGTTLALVGESGCGKSATCLAIMGLLPRNGKVTRGSVKLMGDDLLRLSEKRMTQVRGKRMAMVFQDPMSSLHPLFTVGQQLSEVLRIHQGLHGREARRRAMELLELVRIPAPSRRMDEYPHRLSGGMRQRVMIALALAGDPEILLADEPTTALDVTTQAQILELLKDLQAQLGMAVILVTHDLGIVAEAADEVAVMYAGRIVERTSVGELFANPLHPYSLGLLQCVTPPEPGHDLRTIPGSVPNLLKLPRGCAFWDRCPHRLDPRCETERPPLRQVGPHHYVATFCDLRGRQPASFGVNRATIRDP